MILRIIKILFYLIMLACVLGILASLWLKTDNAKKIISKALITVVKEETGYDLEIENLELALPITASLDRIILKNQDNIILDVQKLEISILPSLLFFNQVTIKNIVAQEVIISSAVNSLRQNVEEDNKQKVTKIPDIIIDTININKLIILNHDLSTKKEEELSVNLAAYVKIFNNAQQIKIITQTNLLEHKNEYVNGANLSAIINYNAHSNVLQVDNLDLKSPAANVNGNLRVSNDELKGNINYNSSIIETELEKYFSGIKGEVSGAIKISGKPEHIKLETEGIVTAKLSDIDFYKFPDMKWQTATNIKNGKVWGDIKMQQANFTAKGNFSYQDKIFALNNLITQSDISTKHFSMIYNAKKDRLDMDVSFKTDNIRDLQEYLPLAYEGTADIKGKCSIEKAGKKIAADLQASFTDIESGYFKLASLDAKLNTNNAINDSLHKIEIALSRFISGNLFIKQASINASGSNDILSANTKISSQIMGGDMYSSYPIELDLEKYLQIKTDHIVVGIKNISGKAGAANINMKKLSQIKVFVKDNKFEKGVLNIPEISVNQGKLSMLGDVDHNKIKIETSFDSITKDAFPDILTSEFNDAIFSGQALLTGSFLSPVINTSINIRNLVTLNKKSSADLLINSQITKNKMSSTIDVNVRSNNDKKNVISISSMLPISFQLTPFMFNVHQDKEFELNYVTKDKFNILNLIRLPIGHKISGILEGKLFARGTLDKPIIEGNLEISNGKYSYKNIGLKTKDIVAKINAAGNKLFVKDIKIGDYFNKVIEGNGQIEISKNFPYKAILTTEEFNLLNNPYIQGVISGKVALNGDLDKAKAKGDIIIGPMEIKIPERFNESFPTLNVVEVIEEAQQDTKEQYSKQFDLELDISAQTNDKVFVRGWGVNTRLEGKLHIVGTSENPQINGKLISVKGKFNEFGKQLDITKGELIFTGPIPPSPYIDIIGTYVSKSGDQTREIKLGLNGTILDPSINISAIPETSQKDALSILLFGHEVGSNSAFQAFQLASSMRKFSGQGEGINPIEIGKKVTGIDEVNIKQDSNDDSNAAIGFGKYISDNFYIEVEQGFQDNTKTKIEVELTPKISLEGMAESTGNNNVGINWRFEY